MAKKLEQEAPKQECPPTHEDDPLLTQTEVARRLGKSPGTIRNWVRDGLLEFVRQPSQIPMIRRSVVNKFLGGSALNKQV